MEGGHYRDPLFREMLYNKGRWTTIGGWACLAIGIVIGLAVMTQPTTEMPAVPKIELKGAKPEDQQIIDMIENASNQMEIERRGNNVGTGFLIIAVAMIGGVVSVLYGNHLVRLAESEDTGGMFVPPLD